MGDIVFVSIIATLELVALGIGVFILGAPPPPAPASKQVHGRQERAPEAVAVVHRRGNTPSCM